MTRSRLDRAVVARYFGFLVASQLIIFTLIGVLYRALRARSFSALISDLVSELESIALVVLEIGQHQSAEKILKNFTSAFLMHTAPLREDTD